MKATAKRLGRLESVQAARDLAGAVIHCVRIGDGPQLKADGSECMVYHNHVVVLGGEVPARDAAAKR